MRRYPPRLMGICLLTVAGILPLFIGLVRTPIPWVDEVFFASTSISVLSGHAATPSVLDAFPNTGRFDRFYGPVGIYIGAFWMKIFGVSAWAWRMLSFISGVSIILLTILIVRTLDGNGILSVAAAFLVAFSSSFGSSINAGRLDTLTIALELAALYILLGAMRQTFPYRWIYSAVAGLLIAASALSTPRALTFCLGLAAGAIALMCLGLWKQVLDSFLPAVCLSSAAVCAWVYSQGLSPVGWLQYLARASKANTGFVSPVLGGTWHSRDAAYLPELAAQALLAVITLCVFWLCVKERHNIELRNGYRTARIFVLVVALVNVLLCFGFLSQELTYQVFFIVPELIGLTVFSQLMLQVTRSNVARRLLITAWLAFAMLGLGIRGAKIIELS